MEDFRLQKKKDNLYDKFKRLFCMCNKIKYIRIK
jgi:hypothetical protein